MPLSIKRTKFSGSFLMTKGFGVSVIFHGYNCSVFRYMCAHALSLSHPGIRCRCLAAYGDAVSAVKWSFSDMPFLFLFHFFSK